jgi:hypothetical protein
LAFLRLFAEKWTVGHNDEFFLKIVFFDKI